MELTGEFVCASGAHKGTKGETHHQHHAHVSRSKRRSRRPQDERYHSYRKGNDDVKVSLACPVGMPGIDVGRYDGQHIWWTCQEQGTVIKMRITCTYGRRGPKKGFPFFSFLSFLLFLLFWKKKEGKNLLDVIISQRRDN